MKERRFGRIINILSINAKAPRGGSAPTTVSRAAGLALTKVLAHELAPYNILVNALCVGAIKSTQWERRHQREAPELSYDAFLADAAKAIPLGRVGEAEEFANVACFLASDAASYVTGTAINVDGGLSPVT
jgi:NAD(P)-dependent dehydrogenase (short-subunit alcohol dehydrogenase family)